MQLILASGNPHKADELSAIFRGHTVLLPKQVGVEYEHEEVAESFQENAYGKARTLYNAIATRLGRGDAARYSVLADDSGLCVRALAGRPGVYSARYGDPDGTKGLTDVERNRLLLSELDGVNDRSAHFVCAMVLLHSPERFVVAQEAWHGEIAREPSDGAGGFGYDPLFYLPELGRTAADLPTEEKNRLSHRARASRIVKAALDTAEIPV